MAPVSEIAEDLYAVKVQTAQRYFTLQAGSAVEDFYAVDGLYPVFELLPSREQPTRNP